MSTQEISVCIYQACSTFTRFLSAFGMTMSIMVAAPHFIIFSTFNKQADTAHDARMTSHEVEIKEIDLKAASVLCVLGKFFRRNEKNSEP
ncbi:hypothetical protein ACI6Q2_18320 [Chitinophagaceae bacterium LWZ2-11]